MLSLATDQLGLEVVKQLKGTNYIIYIFSFKLIEFVLLYFSRGLSHFVNGVQGCGSKSIGG